MYIDKLIEFGKKNHNEIETNEFSGDKSWEYCHEIFKKYHKQTRTDEDIDLLCLHLAWYLASWGMLRNSFLRLKSYKIHKEAVELIYNDKWEKLWNINFSDVKKGKYAKLIIELSTELDTIYQEHLTDKDKHITDTLKTKILLGTIGCVPAYDTYFKNALKNTAIASNTYNEESLIALSCFYENNEDKFKKLREVCSESVQYTSAKILDMCFFQYGFLSSKIEELASEHLKNIVSNFDTRTKKYRTLKRYLCLSVIHGCEAVRAKCSSNDFDLSSIRKEILEKLKKDKNYKEQYSKYCIE